MGLVLGIVGLPNVGKSTLFRALTRVEAEAANYPFCTIEPNVGIVPVQDERLQKLNELIKPEKCVPATLKVVDIAGLVKGASEGEGLGNQFLSHIREVQAIAHLVRCFEDENIAHVTGKPSALDDLEIVETELILADLSQLERKLERLSKQMKGKSAKGSSPDANETAVFQKMHDHLASGKMASSLELSEEEEKTLQELQLLTAKPFFYVANLDEEELENPGPQFQALEKHAAQNGKTVIPVSAKLEAELSEMDEEESREFQEEMGIQQTGLDQVILRGYELLNQITYFTAGAPEVRAWEIQMDQFVFVTVLLDFFQKYFSFPVLTGSIIDFEVNQFMDIVEFFQALPGGFLVHLKGEISPWPVKNGRDLPVSANQLG